MQLDYDRIDSELKQVLDVLPPLNVTRENVVSLRESLASRPRPPTQTKVHEEKVAVPTAEGDVDVYIFRKSESENQPALLWIHGGGYVFGNADEERPRVIAEQLDITVVSVQYRLAPEHPFPAGPNDCYEVLEWMSKNSALLKIDPERIAIAGASAGGGMAAGVAMMARDRGGPDIRMQVLLYPMIDNLHDSESGQFENHPVWNQGTSFQAWDMYLDGRPGLDASPYAAAARAEDLAGLPPTYICVGSEDLFRDEDIEYGRRLVSAGVPCEFTVFPGLYHAGDAFLPQARVSQRLQASFLKALDDGLS